MLMLLLLAFLQDGHGVLFFLWEADCEDEECPENFITSLSGQVFEECLGVKHTDFSCVKTEQCGPNLTSLLTLVDSW